MTTAADEPRPSSVPPAPKAAARALGARPRVSRFLRVLTVVTAGAQLPAAFAAWELARRLALPAPAAWGVLVWLGGLVAFWRIVRNLIEDGRTSRFKVLAIDLPFYVEWTASGLAFFPLALATPLLAATGHASAIPGVVLWTYAALLAVCAYGVLVRRRWVVVERREIAVEGLPPELDGLRVAHLSDMHLGAYTPRAWAERWVRRANAERPDLVVVTGDMVTSGVRYHGDIADVIGALSAPLGVFVAMGNHDYFGEGEPLVSLIGARGPRVLRNEGVRVERGGAAIYLAAVDDVWTRRADLGETLAARPEGTPCVLLAHDPEVFRDAAKAGVDLVLSGHTHGGQLGVPFLAHHLNFSRITHHYTLGLYRKGKSTLYVHPGLGVTGPPIRIGVAPAVTILTLRKAR